MKMLITSGGTKVPIDAVRDITNMSSGTFGSKIAKAALASECWDVSFLCAKDSKTPFKFSHDCNEHPNPAKSMISFAEHLEFCHKHRDRYQEFSYRNFDDYERALWEQLQQKPDVVVLAAAVSDYVVEPISGKIRSGDNLTIQLTPAQKLIGRVKKEFPDIMLVGFKLLVGSTSVELRDAMIKSIIDNACDIVVGNDLLDLKAGNHQLSVITQQGNSGFPIQQVRGMADKAARLFQIIAFEYGQYKGWELNSDGSGYIESLTGGMK